MSMYKMSTAIGSANWRSSPCCRQATSVEALQPKLGADQLEQPVIYPDFPSIRLDFSGGALVHFFFLLKRCRIFKMSFFITIVNFPS